MNFEEWWSTLLPAEVDELKGIFLECWYEAQDDLKIRQDEAYEEIVKERQVEP